MGLLPPQPFEKLPNTLLASWFGAGYAAKMPGTVGSLAALPFAYLLYLIGGSTAILAASVFITILGIEICNNLLKKDPNLKDPGWIVIDEVAGMWLALSFIPLSFESWIVAFIIFRLLDIYKPWPISIPDKKMTGGKGIMLDDVYAGVITAIILGFIY